MKISWGGTSFLNDSTNFKTYQYVYHTKKETKRDFTVPLVTAKCLSWDVQCLVVSVCVESRPTQTIILRHYQRYDPRLEKFCFYAGINDPVAEQKFGQSNPLKKITRNAAQYFYFWLLHVYFQVTNEQIEIDQREKGELIKSAVQPGQGFHPLNWWLFKSVCTVTVRRICLNHVKNDGCWCE